MQDEKGDEKQSSDSKLPNGVGKDQKGRESKGQSHFASVVPVRIVER
jgi:hypothetical protein